MNLGPVGAIHGNSHKGADFRLNRGQCLMTQSPMALNQSGMP